MCYFVTVAVPQKHKVALQEFQKAGFALNDDVPNSIFEEFGSGMAIVQVLHRGCSCDFAGVDKEENLKKKLVRQEKKYRARGWSEIKIQRALDEIKKSVSTSKRSELAQKFVRKVAEVARSAGEIHILTQWVGGEKKPIRRLDPISSSEFLNRDECPPEETFLVVQVD